MKVKIHREGTNILIILLLILLVVNASAWMFIRPAVIPIVFSSVSGVFYLLVVNFFRSPRRHFPGKVTDSLVVSSVDGRVVALEQVYESEVLHRDVIQLSVFMSVVNVHANWFPVNGEVKLVRHHGGRFLSAYLPKASLENGEEANIEDHLGFIKFGSRVDIFLPLDTEILVKIGDKTVGGITEVARLRTAPSSNT